MTTIKSSNSFIQQFTEEQLKQIELGKKANLDTSVYADSAYTWQQMALIRQGLIDHLDVSVYTNPKYNVSQMKQIYLGLKKNLDVSKYADPSISARQMEQIRSSLTSEKETKVKSQFTEEQLEQINKGKEEGINVSIYTNPKFTADQMKKIRYILSSVNQDTHRYSQILKYLDEDLKILISPDSHYDSDFITYFLGSYLFNSSMLHKCLSVNFTLAHIKEILAASRDGIDMSFYIDSRYSAEQLKWIRLGLSYVEITPHRSEGREQISELVLLYCNPRYSAEQMEFLLSGIQQNPDGVKYYLNPAFSYSQMLEIYTGIRQKLKVQKYADPAFDADQMHQIRLGMLSDLDVNLYANSSIPADQMKIKRMQLIEDSNTKSSPELLLISDTLQTMQEQINKLTRAVAAIQEAVGCSTTSSESAEDDEE